MISSELMTVVLSNAYQRLKWRNFGAYSCNEVINVCRAFRQQGKKVTSAETQDVLNHLKDLIKHWAELRFGVDVNEWELQDVPFAELHGQLADRGQYMSIYELREEFWKWVVEEKIVCTECYLLSL